MIFLITVLVFMAVLWLVWVLRNSLGEKKSRVLLIVMGDQAAGAEMFVRRVYREAAVHPHGLVPIFWAGGSVDDTARIIAVMSRRQAFEGGCFFCRASRAGRVYLWDVRGMTPAELRSAPLPLGQG